MTSYNPTNYQQLLEEYGFKKDVDFFAYYCDDFDMARARVDKIAQGWLPDTDRILWQI